MNTILNVIHVLLAASMIAIILVQRGAGAAAGASFGAGASQTVFGSAGAGNFLTKTTGILATGFFAVSLTMAMLAGRTVIPTEDDNIGIMSDFGQQTEIAVPGEGVDPELPLMMTDKDGDSDVMQSEVPAMPDSDASGKSDAEGGTPE